MSLVNPLLLRLSAEQQKALVEIIKEDLDNATNARNEKNWGTDNRGVGIDFETKYADLIRLYEGADETRPEEWMCGRSLKISQAVVELLVARLTKLVWNPGKLRWRPVEFTDKKQVETVNKTMYWTLNVWMKIYKFVREYIRVSIMMGTVYTESYWYRKQKDLDQTEKIPLHDETGMPIMDHTGQPMYLESRLLHTEERPALRIIPITDLYIQPGQTDIQKEPVIKKEKFYYYELEQMQRQGLVENVTTSLREAVDNDLKDKFKDELAKAENLAVSGAKLRNAPVDCLVWYGNYDADGDGFDEDICAFISEKEDVFFHAYKVSKISRRGKRPLVKTNFIDRIHKFLGIGVLEQIKPLAEEIDACFRQLQDANTMSILRWGFYDPNSDYNPEEHVAKPRAMYPVTNPSQNVYFPDIAIPIERLLNAIRLLLEFVERLTAASSYALGKESDIVGGSGTATRVNEISSSATIRFNLPADNLREGLSEIITNIFDLCCLNMPEGLEKRILGEDNQPIFRSSDAIQEALLLEMDAYLLPNDVESDADTMRDLAVLLYDKMVLGGNPLVVGDANRIWHATANVLKAFGEEPMEWIGKPSTLKETNDPIVENTIIREGRIIHPEPQENHVEHIMMHEKVLSPNNLDTLTWPPETLQALRAHIDEHKQMLAMIVQFQSSQKKGGLSGLSKDSANSGGNTTVTGATPGAAGQSAVQSVATPASAGVQQQTSGTTAGTPKLG